MFHNIKIFSLFTTESPQMPYGTQPLCVITFFLFFFFLDYKGRIRMAAIFLKAD